MARKQLIDFKLFEDYLLFAVVRILYYKIVFAHVIGGDYVHVDLSMLSASQQNGKQHQLQQSSRKSLFLGHPVHCIVLLLKPLFVLLQIVVDYVNYRNMDLIASMEVSVLKNATKRNRIKGSPRLVRYNINLQKGTVRRRHLRTKDNLTKRNAHLYPVNRFDFPVINPKFRFERYCYVYGVAMRSDRHHIADNSLVKKDLCGGRKDRVVHLPDHYFQEPQFVPRPNTVAEDDGILIVLALDGRKKQSYIAIYDARYMVRINIAWLPTVVPFSLHGNFFPGQI